MHLAVFVELESSCALGLPQLGGRLRRDGASVAGLQHLPLTPPHAGFGMKGLEVFEAEPARIGIEGLVLQGPATEQMHPRTPPQRAQGQMGAGEPASHDQDSLALQ